MKLANKTRITYKPRPDATPESELAVLAAVYAFILDRHAKRKAAEGSGDDMKLTSGERRLA
jgi:hypothetical protein